MRKFQLGNSRHAVYELEIRKVNILRRSTLMVSLDGQLSLVALFSFAIIVYLTKYKRSFSSEKSSSFRENQSTIAIIVVGRVENSFQAFWFSSSHVQAIFPQRPWSFRRVFDPWLDPPSFHRPPFIYSRASNPLSTPTFAPSFEFSYSPENSLFRLDEVSSDNVPEIEKFPLNFSWIYCGIATFPDRQLFDTFIPALCKL